MDWRPGLYTHIYSRFLLRWTIDESIDDMFATPLDMPTKSVVLIGAHAVRVVTVVILTHRINCGPSDTWVLS